ncbi:kinase suppressor of Ras 1-like [Oscarella lobularis]|uniref:kinase suppressor of Ras 1-like n=1 Tax=Oscarella lobularis TaxID=121494 RepID=UPI003313492D
MRMPTEECYHAFSTARKVVGLRSCSLCKRLMLRAVKCKLCRLKCHAKCSTLYKAAESAPTKGPSPAASKGMDVFPAVRHRVQPSDARCQAANTWTIPTTPVVRARVDVGQASAIASLQQAGSIRHRTRDARSLSVPTVALRCRRKVTPPRGSSGSASIMKRKASFDSVDEIDMDAKEQEVEEFSIPYERIEFGEKLGDGCKGSVYQGRWHGSVRVHTRQYESTDDLDEFWREAIVWSSIRHENIELFMGACVTPPHLAIITGSHRVDSLYTCLHVHNCKYPLPMKMKIAREIAQGMSYLHSRGIVHGSLNSRAVYVDSKVKISMASYMNNYRDRADDNLPTDVLVYLAPEVVQALRLGSSEIGCPTKEGDVYAFGTVLFELFTGKYPCSDATAEDVMTKVIQGFYTLMAGSMLLRNIKAVVATCWALDPCSRPSFKALLSGLTRTTPSPVGKSRALSSSEPQLDKLGKD